MFAKFLIVVALMGFGLPTTADIQSADRHGFTLEFSAESSESASNLFAVLSGQIGQWWHPDHTWFGDPNAMSIEPVAGGCFCEHSAAGSAMHMTVGRIQAPTTLVLLGGLGPLQAAGLNGAMHWQIKEAGDKRLITLRYTVHGFSENGIEHWAKPVNSVLGLQFRRFLAHAEQRPLPTEMQ